MNNKIVFGVLVLVILFACCSCNLDTRKLLLGCYWQKCVPERSFHVLDWKIPADMFSADAKVSDMYIPSEGEGEIERGSQSIFWNDGNGLAGYDIYRYRTIKSAIQKFEAVRDHMVDDDTKKAWVRPQELTFTSSTADQFQLACGDWSGRRCGLLVRYQEYVILFTSVMDDKMMYAQFEKIATYIDQQMSDHLYP